MTDQTTGAAVSDYDTIGGGARRERRRERFLRARSWSPATCTVLRRGRHGRLKRHQVLLVSQVLGGPDSYEGRPLAEAHDGLGIDHDDFTAVAGHLTAALRDAGVPEDIIRRAIAAVAATEPDIVNSGSPQR